MIGRLIKGFTHVVRTPKEMLSVTANLTADQIESYSRLRGYAGGAGAHDKKH